MTLQELLKNDEDKRSDHGGKSGEQLVSPADGADGDSSASAAAGDMFIKAGVTTVSQSVSQPSGQPGGQISQSVASNSHLFLWRASRVHQEGFCENMFILMRTFICSHSY